MGRWLRHSYYPNWNLRLFQHRFGRFERLTSADTESGDVEVHEHVVDRRRDGADADRARSLRLPDRSPNFVEKHNRYSNWEAHVTLEAAMGNGHRPQSTRARLKAWTRRLPCRPLLRFLYLYVWQCGFLDGREGYYFARLHALYEFLSVTKTFELRKRRTGQVVMRIHIIGINYWPEVTGIAVFSTGRAEHLASAGHDVTMCAAVPYYPQWRVPAEYRRARSSRARRAPASRSCAARSTSRRR